MTTVRLFLQTPQMLTLEFIQNIKIPVEFYPILFIFIFSLYFISSCQIRPADANFVKSSQNSLCIQEVLLYPGSVFPLQWSQNQNLNSKPNIKLLHNCVRNLLVIKLNNMYVFKTIQLFQSLFYKCICILLYISK